MPRLVMNTGNRHGFEGSFNPSLRMSTAAMASVKFKLDKEKAKYEKTIKVLDLSEKMEMRIAQRQVEEVKKELTLMRAYQHVAKQMAFKNFDPVIRRRRERREKERREKEEAALQQQQKQQQDKEDDENDSDDDNGDDPEENRRLSMNGNVFVTLQDIMGNDAVLRRNSKVIHEKRRQSQASLEHMEYGDDSFLNSRRRKSNASSLGTLLSPRQGSIASVEGSSDNNDVSNGGCDEIDGEKDNISSSKVGLLDIERLVSQRRRRSRAGSFGMAGLDSIQENGLETRKDKETNNNDSEKEKRCDSSIENKTNSLVVSGRKGFKTTGNVVKGFFITSSTDDSEEKTGKNSKGGERDAINDKRERPMTIFQISKYYEQQKSRHMEDRKNKDINQQKMLERRKYESLRRRLQKEKFDKEKRRKSSDASKAASAPDKRTIDSSPKVVEKSSPSQTTQAEDSGDVRCKTVPLIKEPEQEEETTDSKPESSSPSSSAAAISSSPLKGLARFKNAATAVSVQLKIASPKKGKTNRLKNIAAAVMIKESSTSSRVPKAFMYSDAFAERFGRERDKSKATTLEASHRNPEDCKIRPLAMPDSVKAEFAEKWKSLMGNVNSAVHWKVRALREDTGTLNSRQIRRQAREEQPSITSVSPRSPRNPPRSVFPGACKTTWAVKKFVSQEIDDVLKAWHPDNVRRKRNQRMKDKVSFPDFIDRVRTTNSILRSFRSYCKEKMDKKEESNEDKNDENDNKLENGKDDDDNLVLDDVGGAGDDRSDSDDSVENEIFV